MRIIIEIEGLEAIVKTQLEAMPTTAPQASGAPTMTPTAATQSAELRAEARIGAQNAGPAPTAAMQAPGAPPLPFAALGPAAPLAGASDMAAGAAPGPPPEAIGPMAPVDSSNGMSAGAAPRAPSGARASGETERSASTGRRRSAR
jgi:hypothetical protein